MKQFYKKRVFLNYALWGLILLILLPYFIDFLIIRSYDLSDKVVYLISYSFMLFSVAFYTIDILFKTICKKLDNSIEIKVKFSTGLNVLYIGLFFLFYVSAFTFHNKELIPFYQQNIMDRIMFFVIAGFFLSLSAKLNQNSILIGNNYFVYKDKTIKLENIIGYKIYTEKRILSRQTIKLLLKNDEELIVKRDIKHKEKLINVLNNKGIHN
ncbi:hypothetical protein Halha_1932 [Halobacteroides halobius DSM 5150]|uniref:Uncharacterized protein n=1 Tax=Halobacteroides halobius (strain ATCC 35273 / DSM 5150 / MD-1) TaxID=748449 RepID=L0KCP9_HALHC|nr:hypothetical protein [Halobacteroides halobius]AGB41843.1 hypothetical protein Halha_1932 [Halobacteroides halobius DSM 5150]